MNPLPIDAILPELLRAMTDVNCTVLQASPGAGKTTRVPMALLAAPWMIGKRIIMLEPRRLAARAAASWIAQALGEQVGQTVGYRVRMDTKVGPLTRVEVVTEGILTRMLQHDASLDGVGLVIFDEYHERSLQADLGLALCLDVQRQLRDDLRILVMSATLDGAAVARLLGNAPTLNCEGRMFPVDVRYLDREPVRLVDSVADAVLRALDAHTGSILVFLPGVGEIKRVETLIHDRLRDTSISIVPLYGDLHRDAQERAIQPCATGLRKVVLATSIAQTSLTIEGVSVVIDSGQVRVPRFDPSSGMTRLETVRVSSATATQRSGRAGRLEPGICYRLWTQSTQRALAPADRPEILEADMAPLLLELAQWGVTDANTLAWMDTPPSAAVAQARDLLLRLGAINEKGRITAHGQEIAKLPLHPRLAHMTLEANKQGLGPLACDIAALIGERDILRSEKSSDIDTRLRVLRDSGFERSAQCDRGVVQRVRDVAKELRQSLRIANTHNDPALAGVVLGFAYPDRIAQRRDSSLGRFRLANGRGAFLPEHDGLATSEYLAVASLDAGERDARIFLAASITSAQLWQYFKSSITPVDRIEWNNETHVVVTRREFRLGELVLRDEALATPDPERVCASLLEGIRRTGLHVLPWNDSVNTVRARIEFLRRTEPEADWPDLRDANLSATLEQWLAPLLAGMSRLTHLSRLDLHAALLAPLSWPQRQTLDKHAPTHVTVPSGSNIAVDYESGDNPILAVRLQELFGLAETPRIAGGRVPLLLHLLSPGRIPVQVTRDLASFWRSTYAEVKKDLKGRYPKHYWPDDPLVAEPTARAKPRPKREC